MPAILPNLNWWDQWKKQNSASTGVATLPGSMTGMSQALQAPQGPAWGGSPIMGGAPQSGSQAYIPGNLANDTPQTQDTSFYKPGFGPPQQKASVLYGPTPSPGGFGDYKGPPQMIDNGTYENGVFVPSGGGGTPSGNPGGTYANGAFYPTGYLPPGMTGTATPSAPNTVIPDFMDKVRQDWLASPNSQKSRLPPSLPGMVTKKKPSWGFQF